MLTNIMALPIEVAVYGWVPFGVIIVLTLIFSWFYMKYFQSLYDRTCSSFVTSVLALSSSLLTILLVPVDVFIVSFMKTADGDFKDWANNSDERLSYENTVKYGYFTLYSIMILFMFFIIPFIYFYYEENDEETQSSHLCVACIYTIFFVFLVGVLFLLGAVINFRDLPIINSTDWYTIEFLSNELGKDKLDDVFSFVMNVLNLIGMLIFMIYTGYGMVALPFSWIKGSINYSEEHEQYLDRRITVEGRISAINDKYRDGRPMTSSDRRELEALEESRHLIQRQVPFIENESNSLFNKCVVIIRPFQLIIGILLALIGLLIFLSLLLTSIDKAMHSLGYRIGFVLPERTLPNPIDITFVWAQKVFPLDYILLFGIIIFLIFCSLSGITRLGLWFLWIRIYRIGPHMATPQGLLLLCVTLMFTILPLNVILYTLTPQYVMYGSQHYKNMTDKGIHCSTLAVSDECILTRMSSLLLRLFYKAWFFGASYYVGIWIFLAVVLISSVMCIIRKPASSLATAVTDDDFEESNSESLHG